MCRGMGGAKLAVASGIQWVDIRRWACNQKVFFLIERQLKVCRLGESNQGVSQELALGIHFSVDATVYKGSLSLYDRQRSSPPVDHTRWRVSAQTADKFNNSHPTRIRNPPLAAWVYTISIISVTSRK